MQHHGGGGLTIFSDAPFPEVPFQEGHETFALRYFTHAGFTRKASAYYDSCFPPTHRLCRLVCCQTVGNLFVVCMGGASRDPIRECSDRGLIAVLYCGSHRVRMLTQLSSRNFLSTLRRATSSFVSAFHAGRTQLSPFQPA